MRIGEASVERPELHRDAALRGARPLGDTAVRIGVLSNPRAGRSAERASQMASLLGGQPDVMHVLTDGPESLRDTLARFASQDVNLLVVNGGDGTLMQTLTVLLGQGIFEQLPLVAPLRGGRTNMTAIDIGCQRDSSKALASLIEAARGRKLAEHIVDRPVLRIDLGPEDGVQYGLFCGMGLIHRAVDFIHRAFPPTKRARGTTGAGVLVGLLVTRVAFRGASGIVRPDRIAITLDGQAHPDRDFQLAIATTLTKLFLRMNPFWGEEAAPVRFTTIAVGAAQKLRSAAGIFRGRPRAQVRAGRGYDSRNVNRVELGLDCGLCIDGELFAERRNRVVTIEADHRIRFVRN
jgi:diacylglycerol kinase family enzyme